MKSHMTLDTFVASVSENIKSQFPVHGTLDELRAASRAAVDAALSQFDSPIGFFLQYPEALEDQVAVEKDKFLVRPSTGERIDQLAALSLRKRIAPTERDLLLNSFPSGLHAAAWDFLDVAVRCAAGQKLGLLDSEDVKDTRLLFTCDGRVGKDFEIIAHLVNKMMAECIYPRSTDVSPLWSQDIAKRVGGFDKAREMLQITDKFIELGQMGRGQFVNALERAAIFEPTRSLA